MKITPRICHRCGTEMVENCYIQIESLHSPGRAVIKKDSDKLFDPTLGEPRVAICPNCGEISWYVPPYNLSKKLKD